MGSETARSEPGAPGTRAYVLAHEGGAALICVMTEHGPDGPYWVDGREVIEAL